ncbi:glutathione S-transferase [Nitrospirillum viridazoti Y2]|nr:glutathione S-transferase [Nitrospirillum amazonense Y2]
MKLYGAALSPYSARVVLAIRAKGLEIPLVDPPGGQKSAAFQAINPLGKTPVLDADGAYILESAVICEFLEDAFPRPALLPADPVARAAQRTVARLLDLYVLPPLLSLMAQRAAAQTGDAAASANRVADLTRGLDALEVVVDRGAPAGPLTGHAEPGRLRAGPHADLPGAFPAPLHAAGHAGKAAGAGGPMDRLRRPPLGHPHRAGDGGRAGGVPPAAHLAAGVPVRPSHYPISFPSPRLRAPDLFGERQRTEKGGSQACGCRRPATEGTPITSRSF